MTSLHDMIIIIALLLFVFVVLWFLKRQHWFERATILRRDSDTS